MKYLIAQGLKTKQWIKSPSGFRPIRNMSREVDSVGTGVGKIRITEAERALRDASGQGIQRQMQRALNSAHSGITKAIKPLKFRL